MNGKRVRRKSASVSYFGWYHLIHEFVRQNHSRAVDRALKLSSVDGFGLSLGRALALRLMENKMKVQKNALEKVKFIASDLWSALFGKYVDKLETDGEGTFIIQVNSFPLLGCISSTASQEMDEYMGYFQVLFQAIIQAAMDALKISTKVEVKTEN